jgi:hypothetical protein
VTKTPEDGSVQSRNICRVSLKCFKDLHIFRINVHPVGVLNSDCQRCTAILKFTRLFLRYMFRSFDHHQVYNIQTRNTKESLKFCEFSQNNIL